MFYRRIRTSRLALIEATFADLVSRYLYNDPANPLSVQQINDRLKKTGIRPANRNNVQYLISLMIRTQRSISGSNFTKLQKLYGMIPPYGVSIKKISSWNWYRQARGIREIYEMNQVHYLDEVLKYRNDKNIYVRREAQIAMVVFLGWESLRFLPYLKWNMTLWQQIKVVEKLYDFYPQPDLKWLQKVYGTERSFAKRLLMRIIRKFELQSEVEFIMKHLADEDYEVRETAIYCINTFSVSSASMAYIKNEYDKIPDATQKLQLMNYIYENSNMDPEFYLEKLYGPNEDIKLNVAQILWNNGYKEKVQEFYMQQFPKSSLYVG
ncbi:HEAT repeat domain-containing protein [Gramella sp. GC03-9]|uniref:HEAT repeat domain-containing protein n=1 Tax=Christiangramia oceanisediminis TaxID=2920386 RepID=A0A9X2KZ46_9FLAO|nr:HEAT repeat domain-containing protein [Gramella oceanisediminis]MCP9200884.1 HEAT repeat domain-containing protein [Gramella oceanisediminis]